MSKPKVFITRQIPQEALERLEVVADCTVWPHEKKPVDQETLRRELETAHGLYCLLTDRIDHALVEGAPNLKVVSTMAVGYDNIAVDACTERGIVVTNTPGVLTETTADLTFALLMATARRVQEGRRVIEDGEWTSWYPMMLAGQDVFGATIGIVGAGRIGQAVARRAKGFGMRILYHNRNRTEGFEQETGAQYVELNELLRESDFVTVLVPLTEQTRRMFGAAEFALMKPSACFINVARGAVVDEDALYQALLDRQIWAAGLDVFDKEPIGPDHPLLSLPNCTVLPHIGSASIATRTKMATMVADDIVAVLSGNRPKHPVNPDVM